MKRNRFILSLALAAFILNSEAQENSDGSMPQYLFPEFVSGTVRMKNGREQKIALNYNTITEKMVYFQNQNFYDMVSINTIDTIVILNSRFIPVDKVFYEVLYNGQVSFFIQHKGKLMSPGAPAAYGGTSQLSNSKYLNSVELSGGRYNLELPDDYIVKAEPVFWLKRDSIMSSFLNERQFLKLFPQNEQELKKFIKQYHIKFERLSDIIQLAKFINEKKIN